VHQLVLFFKNNTSQCSVAIFCRCAGVVGNLMIFFCGRLSLKSVSERMQGFVLLEHGVCAAFLSPI